jgi:uncharacterized membrane protein
MSILGDALIIAGILILSLTFVLGYVIYVNASQASGPNSVTSGPTNSINSTVSNLANGLSSTLAAESIILVKVVLLFLFANLGYKFVVLGIKANAKPKAKEEKDEEKD